MSRAPAPAGRTRARRGEGELLHTQILDAAEQLLIETGSEEAVSIRRIADAVGVTPPSIYLHFADKDELLFAVCEREFEELDRVTEQAAVGVDDPVDELFKRGKAYVRFGLEHPEQYRILFLRGGSHAAAASDESRIRRASAFDHMVDAVGRCVTAGALPDGTDPTTVALELWAVVHGLTSLLISKPMFSWPDADALTDHLLMATCAGLQAVPPFTSPKRRAARR
ncbi:MAG TPA: TetR/AcrR family transcriptional regulator [Acidimicrobiales bacterium]|nr:TetR/AcrR family transcriptional regulator [Acidimicrobiales bacterium]